MYFIKYKQNNVVTSATVNGQQLAELWEDSTITIYTLDIVE